MIEWLLDLMQEPTPGHHRFEYLDKLVREHSTAMSSWQHHRSF